MKKVATVKLKYNPKLPEPPKVGQSFVAIMGEIGRNSDYQRTLVKNGEKRKFQDEKGVFSEMENNVKKGKKIISE